ncbi:MAG: putative ABC transport system permease protein [Natronomonas sp.]|uniref:ABC transporter permease n=1 Tax=Natronomonas sp. TaxID=2184060 RepID=UPI00398A355D
MTRFRPFRRFPSVEIAWQNLGRNRVRTGLATLGIIIGVVAIVSLGMAGAAIQQQANTNLGSLTSDVIVSSGADSDQDGITDGQVDDIRSVVVDADVVPQKSNATTLSTRSGESVRVSVTGVSQADALYETSAGEAPERLRSGALLSADTAEELGLELGDPVEYDGTLYRLRGFIESDDGFGPGGDELVLPLSALSEQEYYDTVTVVAADGDAATSIADTLEAEFNDEDEEILSVRSFAGAQEDINSFLGTLNLALLGIGLISLVVASVAILNIMLMSTIERRGEIGVLRAVGIRRGEVLRMILAEAAFLGIIGGIIGAILSLGTGLVLFEVLAGDATLVFGWESSRYLLYGFGFAVFASVVSGLYPAWKAANDPPVEALRG